MHSGFSAPTDTQLAVGETLADLFSSRRPYAWNLTSETALAWAQKSYFEPPGVEFRRASGWRRGEWQRKKPLGRDDRSGVAEAGPRRTLNPGRIRPNERGLRRSLRRMADIVGVKTQVARRLAAEHGRRVEPEGG